VCRDFQFGRCTRGAACRFSHGTGYEATAPRGYEPPKAAGACFDFIKGRCFRRDCKFVHDDTAPVEECREFKNGRCSRGDACRFNHVGGPPPGGGGGGDFDERRFETDEDRRGGRRFDDEDERDERDERPAYDDDVPVQGGMETAAEA